MPLTAAAGELVAPAADPAADGPGRPRAPRAPVAPFPERHRQMCPAVLACQLAHVVAFAGRGGRPSHGCFVSSPRWMRRPPDRLSGRPEDPPPSLCPSIKQPAQPLPGATEKERPKWNIRD